MMHIISEWDTIRVSIYYDTLYIQIEKYTIVKNMINILLLLYISKLKNVLKLLI